MFDPPQKKRRRRIVIPILVTLAVAVVAVAGASGDDTRANISYLEDMHGSAAEVSRAGTALNDLVGDLSRIDRTEFESAVGLVDEALGAAQEVTPGEDPDPALVGATTLYRLAIEQWTEGIDGFSRSLLRAADDSSDREAVDDLANALVQVRAGDRIYQALVEELAREDVPSPVAPMPDVELLPMDDPVTVLAPAWVAAVRSETSGVALRPSVRIEQISSDPEFIMSADGDPVVPAPEDETVDITVVVANTGNTVSDPAAVELELGSVGSEETTQASEAVPVIEAASTTSVVFTDVPVVLGSTYEMTVTLRPGGIDLFGDDNQRSMRFVVNAATDEG